jgi:hypothetical protein
VDTLHQAFDKKLEKGTDTAPACNPNNNGNMSNHKVFNDLTISLINALCAKKTD